MSETRYVFWDGVQNVKADHDVQWELGSRARYLDADPGGPEPTVPATARVAIRQARGADRPATPAAAVTLEDRTVVGNLVAPTVRVKILELDDWFVPITDLAAIEIELEALYSINSLLLRIRQCALHGTGPVVFQERFDRSEILKLPRQDKSRTERLAVKQNWQARRRAERAEPARCLTHFAAEVWVSTEARAFQEWKGNTVGVEMFGNEPGHPTVITVHNLTKPPRNLPDLMKPPAEPGWQTAPYVNAWNAWRPRVAPAPAAIPSQALVGCSLIEQIMAGEKKLKIFDYEPTDLVYGKSQNIASDAGRTFPNFRARMRRTMYEVCAYSRIGMELLSQVANDPRHEIHVYPVIVLRKDIGGTAISKAQGYYHDADYEELFQKIMLLVKGASKGLPEDRRTFLNGVQNGKTAAIVNAAKAHHAPLATFLDYWTSKWTAMAAAPPPAVAAAAGGRLGPPPPGAPKAAGPKGAAAPAPVCPADSILEFLFRRELLRDMGASADGVGCEAHFYFHSGYVREHFEEGEYDCRYHDPQGAAVPMTLDGRTWDVVRAAMFLSGDDEVNIETPLFVAFLHEMIHARRFQIGRSAEYDTIADKPLDQFHSESFVHKLSLVADNETWSNVVDRYKGHNREEYDAVEGAGVPVIVNGVVTHVTENTIRTEVGLPLRRRYVNERTALTTAASTVPLATLRARRFRIPAAPGAGGVVAPPPATPPAAAASTLESSALQAIHSLANTLMGSLGVTKEVSLMVEEETFFVRDRDHHCLALYCNYCLRSPDEKLEFWNGAAGGPGLAAIAGLLDELIAARPAVLALIGDANARSALNQIFDDAASDKRIRVLRLLQQLFRCTEAELTAIRGLSPQLQAAYGASDVDAFAGYLMAPAKVQLLDRHASCGITVDPSVEFSRHVAAYLKLAFREAFPTKNWYHTLIHEPMHILSSWRGFNSWNMSSGDHSVNYRVSTKCNLQPYTDAGVNSASDFQTIKDFVDDFCKLDEALEKELGVTLFQRFKGNEAQSRNQISNLTSRLSAYGASDDNLSVEGFNTPGTLAAERARRKTAAIASVNEFVGIMGQGKTLYTKAPRTTANDLAGRFHANPNFPISVGIDQRGDALEVHQMAWADKKALMSVFDEGTVEMFARIILYQLNMQMGREVAAVTRGSGIPYYEPCVHLMCQIVRDFKTQGKDGLRLFAQAIFMGQWQPFNRALEDLRKSTSFGERYTLGFWEAASKLQITNGMNFSGDPFSKGILPLRDKYGIQWLTPQEVQRAVAAETYHDPVCCKYDTGPAYIWDPLVPGLKHSSCHGGGVCSVSFPRPVITAPATRPANLACPACTQTISIPGDEILKPVSA